MMETRVESADTHLLEALQLLRAGGVVALPTETVYGLGADARDGRAVEKIYAAKGRPSTNPLIVHVADVETARRYAGAWPGQAELLARAFWPGPLTIIVPRGGEISERVSAGRNTVALRVPRHRVAEALLRMLDGPVAAPSANRSGFVSPTTAGHVLAELSGRIPLIIDGGPSDVGLESTVIDVSGDGPPTLLRPGAVTAEMIEAVIGPIRAVNKIVARSTVAKSPGLHERHYAPATPAFRFTRSQWPAVKASLHARRPSAVLSSEPSHAPGTPHETLLLPADAAHQAQVLYDAVRRADALDLSAIYLLTPEETDGGLWRAIADRVRRATEPFAPDVRP